MLKNLRNSELYGHFLEFISRLFDGLIFSVIGAGFLGKIIGMRPEQVSNRLGENGLFFILVVIISVFIVWSLELIRGD